MSLLQLFFLSLIQGLTEFLPVSSSGHLVIAQKLLGFKEPPIVFDIILHLGSLTAVLIYFRKQFLSFSKRLTMLTIIGTIPAVIVGLFLNQYIEIIFNSVKMVGASLIITAFLLFSTKFIKSTTKKLSQINILDAILIGIMQAVAILPGVSRSGSTMVGGLWRKLNQETAFIFSFYLAVPAILGAAVLKMRHIDNFNLEFFPYTLGFLVSIVVSYLALKILHQVIITKKLALFGFYCFTLGILALFFL